MTNYLCGFTKSLRLPKLRLRYLPDGIFDELLKTLKKESTPSTNSYRNPWDNDLTFPSIKVFLEALI